MSSYSGSFAGITSSFSYNKRLQPVNISAGAPTQTVLSLSYDYHLSNGNNGTIFAITNNIDNNRNQSFTHDQLNRVTSAQNAGTDCNKTTVNNRTEYWGENYGYDAWGNLLSMTVSKCSGDQLSVNADAQNRIHAISGTDYGYDAAGNMTYDATANLNYSYDQENRISGTAGYTYAYDGSGNRVTKSSASGGTIYWYAALGVIAESDLSGNMHHEYVFFGGRRVARKDLPAKSVVYYFSDHLHSTSVITDSAGNKKAESDYRPYGAELQIINNDPNDYKFTGKKRDAESGLDFFGARYYSSGFGRFVTPDWSAGPATVPYAHLDNPQTLNLYSYVDNNPINSIDADGHSAQEYMIAPVQGSFGNGMIDGTGNMEEGEDGAAVDAWNAYATAYNDAAHAYNEQLAAHDAEMAAQNTTQGLVRDATVSTDRFRTRDAAAMAAERVGLKLTKGTNQGKTNWEFGGWIVKDKKGYGYTIPMIGAVRGKTDLDNMVVPAGFQKVAGYHTHPDETSRVGEGFSTGPAGDTGWADRNRYRFYVADVYTRNLYRYDPGVTKVRGYDQVTGDLVGHIPE